MCQDITHQQPWILPPAKVDFWHLPQDQTLVVAIVGRLTPGDRSLPACIIAKYPYRQPMRWNTFLFLPEESNLRIVLPVLSSHYRRTDFKTIYTEMFAMYIHKVFAITWNEKLFAERGTFEHTQTVPKLLYYLHGNNRCSLASVSPKLSLVFSLYLALSTFSLPPPPPRTNSGRLEHKHKGKGEAVYLCTETWKPIGQWGTGTGYLNINIFFPPMPPHVLMNFSWFPSWLWR